MTRHIASMFGSAVLATMMVISTAGAASATFRRQSVGTLSATTFKLEPPTGLSATCTKTNGNRMPVVTFTSSISIGDVPDHPLSTPPQVFSYVTGLKVNGVVDPAGATTLGPQATKWSGLKQNSGSTLQLSIVTTYGGWTSGAATVTFQC
jgi:hypothetical protein